MVWTVTWMFGGLLGYFSLMFARAFKKNSHGFSADHQQACCIMLTAIKKKNNVRHWIIFVMDSCLWALIPHWLKNPARSIYSQNRSSVLAHARCRFEAGPKLERFWQRKGVWAEEWTQVIQLLFSFSFCPLILLSFYRFNIFKSVSDAVC